MFKRKTAFLIIAVAMLIISTVSFSVAKYIDRREKFNLATSSNFFFVLDVEDNSAITSPPYYVVGNQINIKVSNTDGLNINSSDITYSITVENAAGDNITNSLTLTGNDGLLPGGVSSTDNISISGVSVDSLYIVKISSTLPYTKTLSAKFMFRNTNNTYYTITDNGNYISLNLYISNILPTNNLTISYGINLAPDNTNNLMQNWIDATSGTIFHSSLLQNSTYTFVFFEQNTTGNYARESTMLDLTSAQTITITAN